MAEIKAALLPIRRGYEAPKETVNNPLNIINNVINNNINK